MFALYVLIILILNPLIGWLLIKLVDNTIGVDPNKFMGGFLVCSIFVFCFSLEVSLVAGLIKESIGLM